MHKAIYQKNASIILCHCAYFRLLVTQNYKTRKNTFFFQAFTLNFGKIVLYLK